MNTSKWISDSAISIQYKKCRNENALLIYKQEVFGVDIWYFKVGSGIFFQNTSVKILFPMGKKMIFLK